MGRIGEQNQRERGLGQHLDRLAGRVGIYLVQRERSDEDPNGDEHHRRRHGRSRQSL